MYMYTNNFVTSVALLHITILSLMPYNSQSLAEEIIIFVFPTFQHLYRCHNPGSDEHGVMNRVTEGGSSHVNRHDRKKWGSYGED